jgi:hypothetical protein
MKEARVANNGQWLCPDCGGVAIESCVCEVEQRIVKALESRRRAYIPAELPVAKSCCEYHERNSINGITRLGPDGCAGPWPS